MMEPRNQETVTEPRLIPPYPLEYAYSESRLDRTAHEVVVPYKMEVRGYLSSLVFLFLTFHLGLFVHCFLSQELLLSIISPLHSLNF
jgi:hypothetical protein